MLTESQRRALRAKQLLDSGRDPKEVAREMGYTRVSAMLGAITLCEARLKRDEKRYEDACREASEPAARDFLGKTLHVNAVEQTPDGLRAECVIKDEMHLAKPMPMVTVKPSAKIYPMENGVITVHKGDVSVSWKPKAQTAFINVNNYRQAKWLPLYGNIFGGRRDLAQALRQIAEAATEAAALIEEEAYVDHHAR